MKRQEPEKSSSLTDVNSFGELLPHLVATTANMELIQAYSDDEGESLGPAARAHPQHETHASIPAAKLPMESTAGTPTKRKAPPRGETAIPSAGEEATEAPIGVFQATYAMRESHIIQLTPARRSSANSSDDNISNSERARSQKAHVAREVQVL